MTNERIRARILALAGIFQGASLVAEIAAQGKTQQRYFNASISSLLNLTEEGIDDIYGGIENLNLGLDNLEIYLGSRTANRNFPYTLNYVRALIRLADLLINDAAKVGLIAEEIDKLRQKHSSSKRGRTSLPLVREIAEIYLRHFSSLPQQYRIRVKGKKEHLTATDNVARIRAALFASIRAAVLWRHVGGRLLSLSMGKGRLAGQLFDIRQEEQRGDS